MRKKIIGILIIIIFLTIIPTTIFADYTGIATNITIGNTAAAGSSVDFTNKIAGVLQVAGTIISVIALIIIGMRYMLSSVDGKAQMKGVIGYYVVGCILVFATSNVLGFAYDMIDDMKHSYKTTTTAATCTSEGSITTTCTDCGKTNKEIIPPLGHSYTSENRNIRFRKSAATCISPAIYYKSCSRCGVSSNSNSYTFTYGSPTGVHNYIKKDTSSAYLRSKATCTTAAQYYYRCSTSNCTAKGTTTFTSGSALGHDYKINNTKSTAATCTKSGLEVSSCSRCNDEIKKSISALGHKETGWIVTDQATCLAQGKKITKCSVCGTQLKTMNIDKIDHVYIYKEEKKKATCLTEGEWIKECKYCKQQITEKRKNPSEHEGSQVLEYTSYNNRTHNCKTKYNCCGAYTTVYGITENCNMEYTGTYKWKGLNRIWKFKCTDCEYVQWNEEKDGTGDWIS